MDTKHIHCMLEKIAEYGKQMMEEAVGAGNVNLEDAGKIVDMVKDLACAEKDALIAKEMRKANEEDEAEEKYIRKILKEENKDEYKRMREEYGEDEGEKRFYDNYRYANGRFAPKGRGSYRPRSGRRGYEEPPYYHMMPEDYKEHDPEYWRDMDRHTKGVMYYTDTNMTGNVPTTATGNDGNVRGYSDGYADGMRDGRRQSGRRDGREGRSGQSRRTYMETKEMNKGNTPQEKQEKMKELEKYMKELAEDVTEMIEDATPEERSLAKQKMQVLLQKL